MSTYKTIDYTYDRKYRTCGYDHRIIINNSDVSKINNTDLADLVMDIEGYIPADECNELSEEECRAQLNIYVQFADGSAYGVHIVRYYAHGVYCYSDGDYYTPGFRDENDYEVEEICVYGAEYFFPEDSDGLIAGMDEDGLIEFAKCFRGYGESVAYNLYADPEEKDKNYYFK